MPASPMLCNIIHAHHNPLHHVQIFSRPKIHVANMHTIGSISPSMKRPHMTKPYEVLASVEGTELAAT